MNKTITDVKVEEDEIKVTFSIKKADISLDQIIRYDIEQEIRYTVVAKIASYIVDTYKDDIVKQVLEGVNWAELSRSEITQRIIKEMATKNYDDGKRNY